MKGKRYTTEEKIRILRDADQRGIITETCKEFNISDVTFQRWKRQFGQMDLNEAKRLKELEKENTELKKMLADALLAKRVLEYAVEKIVSPGHKEQVAQAAVHDGMCSGRAACRILHLARSTYHRPERTRSPRHEQLLQRLLGLSEQYPRYGYRRIAALLRREGWPVGKRFIQKLRRQAGLRVPLTKRKLVRRGRSTGLPTKATHRGHVWTWDFIADATIRGDALRMLTILDEFTRECHVLRADRALRSEDVLQWLQKAIQAHGAPEYLRSDNGSEFIVHIVQRWLAEQRIRTIYIDPGSP
jgi:transposase InsO family protein